MQRRFILLILLVLLIFTSIYIAGNLDAKAYRTMTLEEAIEYGYVYVEIYGTGDYYGKSIYIYIELVKDTSINVEIDRGLIFKPLSDYEEYQRMVVASSETIALSGKGDSEEEYLYAFCIDPFKDVPDYFVKFEVDGKAPYKLIELLEEIEKEGMLNEWEAQLAVWIAANPSEADEIMRKYVMEDYEDLIREYGRENAAKAILEVLQPTIKLLDRIGDEYLIDKYVKRIESDAQKPITEAITDWFIENWYLIFIILVIISIVLRIVAIIKK